MLDFMQRLKMLVLPRVRDFEGLYPDALDNYGNFYLELESQDVFLELDDMMDERMLNHAFKVQINTTCYTAADGLNLMRNFGFPFGDPAERPDKSTAITSKE